MGDAQKFESLVSDIDKAMNTPTPGAGITTQNADLIDSMLRAAEDLYAGMSKDDKDASAVVKNKLDGLEGQLKTWLSAQAADFAKDWLTTDYSGKNDQTPGDDDLTASNRLDGEKDKEGYADRVLLAKEMYDALSAAERAAVDALFSTPTVPELYKETFPDIEGKNLISDEGAARNFVEKYLTVNGQLPGDKYEEMLKDAGLIKVSAEGDLGKMSDDYIDNGIPGLTADEKQALKDARDFINNHLKYDGSVITESNSETRGTIIAARTPWDGLPDEAKAAVNGALTGKYKGQTYEALYAASGSGGRQETADPGDPHANGVADWLIVADHIVFMRGDDKGRFNPGSDITRAEAATAVNRMLARSADKDYVDAHMDSLKLFPDVAATYWAFYNIAEASNAHDFETDQDLETWTGLK